MTTTAILRDGGEGEAARERSCWGGGSCAGGVGEVGPLCSATPCPSAAGALPTGTQAISRAHSHRQVPGRPCPTPSFSSSGAKHIGGDCPGTFPAPGSTQRTRVSWSLALLLLKAQSSKALRFFCSFFPQLWQLYFCGYCHFYFGS